MAITQNKVNVKKYRAALYVRLSNDDENKDIESNSVTNQRALLTNFVDNSKDIQIHDYYIDDGFSGVNFNRPDFQRMISDIAKHNVNCVIVKDLSRLGRNYVEVGKYLDEYFPNNNIRFIAINDNVDRIGSNFDFEMITPIKSLFNENYSRDISKKVTSAFRVKELQGQFIGAFASYGYQKDSNNKNKLIIDPIAAETVKKIFKLFISGTAKIQIAKMLNKEGIPCPSEYKQMNGLKYNNGQRLELTKYWTYSTIHHILKNEIYTGTMVQHKNIRSNFKTKKSTITEEDNWIRVKNTHEAIIDYDTFNKVQTLLQKDTRQIDFKHNIHLFAGFVRCGDCGRAMAKVNRHGKQELVCGSYIKVGKAVCTQHRMPYDMLEKIVLTTIQNLVTELVNTEKAILQNEANHKISKNNEIYNKQINMLKAKLDKTLFLKKGIYEDYKEEVLSKEEYLQYKADYERDEVSLKQQIIELEQANKISGSDIIKSEWYQNLKKYFNIKKLDRMTIATFIDHIDIFENKHIKIYFQNMDKIQQLKDLQNNPNI